jgi:putative transcriptional regulator
MNKIGKLLIAHPNVEAENIFAKTVIYVYQDDSEQGSLGVILNKPSRFRITDIAAEKNIVFGDTTKKVYHGGPVNPQALVLLHSDDWYSTNTVGAGNNLCVSSDNNMLEKISNGDEPAYWRLFGGMCGWAPGQLEAELSGQWPYRPENSWLTADANDSLIYDYDGKSQWTNLVEISSQQMFDKYI